MTAKVLVCISDSKGSDSLRKRQVSMALLGSPLGQAYFLEFLGLLTTVIPGPACLLISLECAMLNYSVG